SRAMRSGLLQPANGTVGAPKALLRVQGGTALAVGDVNGDNNPDIYVACGKTGTTNAPDYLVLGNATGGFTMKTIPETTAGVGEAVDSIDYTQGGLTSFLVLNGQVPDTGPIQLLAPAPTAARTRSGPVTHHREAAPYPPAAPARRAPPTPRPARRGRFSPGAGPAR